MILSYYLCQPIPKKAFEDVLSSYLNTHLPLPCQLNSLHSIKKPPPPPPPPPSHQSNSAPSSPTKLTSDPRRKHSRTLLQENSPAYSLASSGSASSLASSTRRTQSEHPSLHLAEHLEHSLPESHYGMEAVGDVNLPDGVDSVLSSHSSFLKAEGDEEGHTIGSRSSSSLSTSSTRRPSIPRSHYTTPVLGKSLHVTQAPQTQSTTRQQKQKQQQQKQQQSNDSVLPRLRSFVYKFLIYMHQFISWVMFIVQKGLAPYSEQNLRILMHIEKKQSPLTNALFCLGSEASARHCPHLWVCAQNTQLCLLVLAGGGVERFLWRELKVVVCDEVSWTRALYTLRHTLWPGGTFISSSKRKVSEAELEQLKRKAADAFKKFLPSKSCMKLRETESFYFPACRFLASHCWCQGI